MLRRPGTHIDSAYHGGMPHSVSRSGWHKDHPDDADLQVSWNRGEQVLALHLPEMIAGRTDGTPRLAASLPELRAAGRSLFWHDRDSWGMVSAAALSQEAKQFDDGLYAAVDLASLSGAGRCTARTVWLDRLRRRLGTSQAASSLYTAARMLNRGTDVPTALLGTVKDQVGAFLHDELRSKPAGFYTWSDELRALFRHDRVLQDLLPREQLEALMRAVHADPEARSGYEQYLTLIEGLTNPLRDDWVRPALRVLDEGGEPSMSDGAFIPPSVAHETELIRSLYGDRPIPDGFDLMTELVSRVRSGALDLLPTKESGWYDHQAWALDPLWRPDEADEAARLRLNDSYRTYLAEMAKGLLALSRETHYKQLDLALVGAAAGRRIPPLRRAKLLVSPDLSCEPLVTFYRRRADAYRFVRDVLTDHFGPEALSGMRRETPEGAADRGLDEEIAWMIDLFDGAASSSAADIGVPTQGAGRDVFQQWSCWEDPDVAADCRMMVPVFYDLARRKTKAWVMLGWSSRLLSVAFDHLPPVTVRNAAGAEVTGRYRIEPMAAHYEVACPEIAEVYVDRLLDRDEFRALCDKRGTREAILADL